MIKLSHHVDLFTSRLLALSKGMILGVSPVDYQVEEPKGSPWRTLAGAQVFVAYREHPFIVRDRYEDVLALLDSSDKAGE